MVKARVTIKLVFKNKHLFIIFFNFFKFFKPWKVTEVHSQIHSYVYALNKAPIYIQNISVKTANSYVI